MKKGKKSKFNQKIVNAKVKVSKKTHAKSNP